MRLLCCIFETNRYVEVLYEQQKIGSCLLDFYWKDKVVVEVTCLETLRNADEEVLKTKLKHSKTEVGLLLNFGLTPEHKRKILNN